MARFKEFTFKKFGYLDFDQNFQAQTTAMDLSPFIKIIYLKAGGKAIIDFKEYQTGEDALFFVSNGQYYQLDEQSAGTLLYYNRDFYCVEIHDKEVACDGILFNNVYEIPVVYMQPVEAQAMQALFQEIKTELDHDDSSLEEMLRILLKTIIIKATRIWKQAHHAVTREAQQEVEFSRKFSQLVEWHYTRQHTVAEYAELLNITPKALNKRITRYSQTTPNDIIKERIILEAKRLLVHTQLSVKEISYKLGYDDTSYFTRLFTKQVDTSPQSFRSAYQHQG